MKESERWLILMCRSRWEWSAYVNLLRRGIEAFFPYRMESVTRQRYEEGVARAIYPGYLFADMTSAKSVQQIEEIPAVVRALKIGNNLVLLPTSQINTIRRTCSDLYWASLPRRTEYYVPAIGDVVTIPHGMFMGVPAIVSALDKSGRVSASIGNLEVTFHLTDLQKVSVAVRSHGERPQPRGMHG